MRKTVLFLALVVVLTSQSLFAQVPSYVPTNGLVGYWPFNGNANDDSGNGNNGVVNGAALTTDRNGNTDSAYDFDGINDNIIGATNNFSGGNLSRTLSLWFNVRQIPPPGTSFVLLNYGQLNSNQACGLGVTNIGTTFFSWLSENDLEAVTPIPTNQWYNLIATFDGSNSKMYLNGSLISSSNQTKNTILKSLSIGSNGFNQFTDGKLDDIGIWNRVLTQQEITNLYNSVSSNECLTMTINTGILSTNPFTYTSSVSIYPNPANDQITIDCGNLANVSGWSIKITSLLGQEVFSQPMNTQQYVVPLNTWSGQGMYFVKIINAQNEVVNIKKIILQ